MEPSLVKSVLEAALLAARESLAQFRLATALRWERSGSKLHDAPIGQEDAHRAHMLGQRDTVVSGPFRPAHCQCHVGLS